MLCECFPKDSICRANFSIVGYSNTQRKGTSMLSRRATCEQMAIASNECPPNSKKLSLLPTRSRRNTDCQMSTNLYSSSFRGGTWSVLTVNCAPSSFFNALRSTFPLDVKGNDSNTTNRDGIM